MPTNPRALGLCSRPMPCAERPGAHLRGVEPAVARRQPERLATGRCLRPKMLAHVGGQLRHLVLADATLRDLSALAGASQSHSAAPPRWIGSIQAWICYHSPKSSSRCFEAPGPTRKPSFERRQGARRVAERFSEGLRCRARAESRTGARRKAPTYGAFTLKGRSKATSFHEKASACSARLTEGAPAAALQA